MFLMELAQIGLVAMPMLAIACILTGYWTASLIPMGAFVVDVLIVLVARQKAQK